LWGNVVLVSTSGYIIPDNYNAGSLRLDGQPGSGPLRFGALDSALAAKAGSNSVWAFGGKAAVALLRVTAFVPVADYTHTLRCDSVAIVLGSSARTPRYVDFAVRPPAFAIWTLGIPW
jgi:hypothetical protein